MFELLLQADKALAGGHLDQAEKTYWQLIDLDPTNAIAVAGLARVSLERGDEKAARSFADQALSIDPDSIAARRVLETIEHKTATPSKPGPAALPLLAAEQLEALSRRHGEEGQRAPETEATPEKGSRAQKGAAKTSPAATSTRSTPATAAAKKGGHRPETAGAKPEAVPGPARGKESRGRTRPDQIVPLPAEPLRERRQAGRLAAAAAAAAAAARKPVPPRREPHHAMPVGRRLFGPEGLKVPQTDAFSEAEMAAAIAAIDALDESGGAADMGMQAAASGFGATEATTPEESVALRLALLSGISGLEDAEREAARSSHEPAKAEPEAAEAEATGSADFADFADADAAELAAAAEAVHEVAAGVDEMEPEPRRARRPIQREAGEESSEEEAEAQALREALAMVLEGDTGSGVADGPATAAEHTEAAEQAAAEQAAAEQAAAEQAAAEPANEPPEGAAPTAEVNTGPDSAHPKRGLFHRIRGT